MATPRFNLRNASLFLTKLRDKYNQTKNQEQNIYDNTFIDEQEELTSGPSIRNLASKKIDSNQNFFQTDDRIAQSNQNSQAQRKDYQYKTQETVLQRVKQNEQTQFCDLIVIKYLQQTLAIYKSDLQTLEHNRQNLEQQIYFISKKIGKLHETALQNILLQDQINNLNQELKNVIQQYHQSNKCLFKKKLSLQKLFKNYQNKVKKLLLRSKISFSDKYLRTDITKSAYVEEYESFLAFKQEQKEQINSHIQNYEKNPQEIEKQKLKHRKSIFQGKEGIYIHRKQSLKKSNEKTSKQKKQDIVKLYPEQKKADQKKIKKVILYDQDEDEQKQQDFKNKQKTKKLTQTEKALLLGDLKNFSKSFKLPK